MSIFTRTTDIPVEADSSPEAARRGLPDGYDDERGVFFVPPEDRPFYAAQLDKAKSRFKRERAGADYIARSHARELARAAAVDSLGARPETPSVTERHFIPDTRKPELAQMDAAQADWDAFVERWIDEHAPEVESRRIAFHLTQLGLAQHARAQRENRDRNEADILRRNTCPVCGECDLATNGPVDLRDLVFPGSNDASRIRPFISCAACHEVKRQIMLEAWSNAPVKGGRTRREILTAATSNSFAPINGSTN